MPFDTPGGAHTPTMNAPIPSTLSRESGNANFANRHGYGWPLSRTRSHGSPSSAFNYGPSSSVSSLGLESGFMLDRHSEHSTSSDDEYNGDYDSDDLMSMGSRRQSLSTPHYLPIFRTHSNNSIKAQRADSQADTNSDSSQSTGGIAINSSITTPAKNNRTHTTSGYDSSNSTADGSSIKNFFSTFRPDAKKLLPGGSSNKKSPSSLNSFFYSGRSSTSLNSDPIAETPSKTNRFSSLVGTSKSHENKNTHNDQHNDHNNNDKDTPKEEEEESSGRTAIRRFVSNGRSLRPKVKSFLRISRDLQDEMSPFDTEIKQEAKITTALRDDDNYYSRPFGRYNVPPDVNMDKPPASRINTSSFEPIPPTQARRQLTRSDSLKSIGSVTDTESSMQSPSATPAKVAPIATPSVKRKASIIEDSEPSFLKRRAVSPGYVSPVVGSPTSIGGGGKRSLKHLRDTSDGLEKMSLA